MKISAFKEKFLRVFSVAAASVMLFSTASFAETTANGGGKLSAIEQLESVASGLAEAIEQKSGSLSVVGAPITNSEFTYDSATKTVTINTPDALKNFLGNGNKSIFVMSSTEHAKTEYGANYDGVYGLDGAADVKFELGGNIVWTTGNFNPVAEFKATFDGKGNTISGMNILDSNDQTNTGFVKALVGGTIKNVTFSDCSSTGTNNVGMVAATSKDGIIEQVMVKSSSSSHVIITVNGNSKHNAGGIVGSCEFTKDNVNGKINECVVSGTIKDNNTGSAVVGGIIGTYANKSGKPDAELLTSSYWDMRNETKIVSTIGSVKDTSKLPAGMAGIKLSSNTKLVLGSSEETKNLSDVVKVIPSGKTLTKDAHIIWADGSVPHFSYDNSGDGVLTGKTVGSGTLTCTIKVGNASLDMTCAVEVEGDKTELAKLMEVANTYNNMTDKDKLFSSGNLTELSNALTEANNIYTTVLSPEQDITNSEKRLVAVLELLFTEYKAKFNNLLTSVDTIIQKENGFYEPTSFSNLSSAHSAAQTVYNDAKSYLDTTNVTTSMSSLNVALNGLKLLLQQPTIERVENDGAPYIKIVIPGYKKTDSGSNPLKVNQDAELVSVSVGASKPTVINGATKEVTGGEMIIKVPKTAVTIKEYNLSSVFTVVIKDTLDGRTMESASTPVTLDRKENVVTGHVGVDSNGVVVSVDLGKVALGEKYTKLDVTGIPVLYNPSTGEEDGKTTSGKVVSTGWEWDDQTALANGIFDPQQWETTGYKYIKAVIAEPTDGSYKNPDSYEVKAKVEVVDKTLLDGLIKTVNGFKESNYLKESWTPFKLALEDAKKVNSNKEVGQADIDKAYNDLKTAQEGLKSQPIISLKESNVNLRLNDIFEPLAYIKELSDVVDVPGGSNKPEDNILFSKLIVTTGEGENLVVVYENGSLKNPIDTSKEGTHKVTYSVTNTSGITATADLTINVFGKAEDEGDGKDEGNGNGSGNGSGSGNNNGGGSGNTDGSGSGNVVVSGNNTVTDGTIIMEFMGTDIFTEDEINKGVKFIIESKKVDDHSKIQAILDKLASLLSGEVTIDGVYDITIYKEIDGKKSKIANSEIKNALTVYLPISQQAIDSNDYAVIHALDNDGYEIFRGTVKDKDSKNYIVIKAKSFSEYGVVYGGGISGVAQNMDESELVSGGSNATGGGNGSGGGSNQGGGDGSSTALVATGDTSIIFAVAALAIISVVAGAVIVVKKSKLSK